MNLKIILIISYSLLILSVKSYSQGYYDLKDSLTYKTVYMKRTHNVFGFVPAKARVTNGWAFGLIMLDSYSQHMDSVRINGLYTNVGPAQLLMVGMVGATIALVVVWPGTYINLIKHRKDKDTVGYSTSPYEKPVIQHRVNGLSIGLFDMGETFAIHGLQINALLQTSGSLNGVSVAGLINIYSHEFKGVMISGLANSTDIGKGLQVALVNMSHSELRGVQIGLINYSKKMKGVQLGLWNKIGKRGLPFINFNF